MTISDAKRELPDVLVKMPNNKIYRGRVSGRKLQFPMVTVLHDDKLFSKGWPPWIDFETTWEQIARKATDRTPIIYF